MGKYAKTIVAVLIAVLTAAQTILSGWPLTTQGWMSVIGPLLGAVAVYLIPNHPGLLNAVAAVGTPTVTSAPKTLLTAVETSVPAAIVAPAVASLPGEAIGLVEDLLGGHAGPAK
ncbi:MAG: hypothetical protein ACRDRO_11785 [Pseudonocardiaceae bacterium]